ncbi:metallophosphoesterase [Agrilactobacillus composti DSM 18527 = JCM 14202]|uniref:Metallophosphoesterase n=1 Tax=Agrilactobacillus composti DSM 18527 = JCM 14202 TaxID=1423734 RepID=X0PNQ4_9LACO|nr:metallophosphoesterase [Agrilactobacillus composti]KRM33099.1 metallophosphoesterase [Agrilactobacillus composti DSM 18527 = JCM 14202]GAF38546.1 diadenosine tetraphosphatase related serine/threonine protein phosphatase [Agrilactobacillus composti DSM 18527 = JCM 14202]
MKIAALYDIHGNYPALAAISKQLTTLAPDLIVFGGDLISGPMPLKTLALIKKLEQQYSTVSIMGNNDQDVIDAANGQPLQMSDHGQQQIQWVAKQLNDQQITALKRLQPNVTLGNYFFCHAVAGDNRTIFTPHSDIQKIQKLFAGIQAPFIICGHTHIQFKLKLGDQEIINAGSVGMPFSNQAGAQWLWLTEQTAEFKTTPVAKPAAIKAMQTSSFPFLSEFIDANVKHTTSLAAAYKILDQLTNQQ